MVEIVAVSAAQLFRDSAELDAIAEMFATAFETDPGMRYIAGGEGATLHKNLFVYFQATLPIYANPLWMLRENGRYVGGAVVSKSNVKMDWTLGVRAMWQVFRKAEFGIMNRAMNYGKRLEPFQPTDVHLTLEYLAVHPDAQGRGYGRQLLDHVAKIAQETPEVSGIWLDSPNPKNVTMYEHFGYEATNDVTISGDVGTTVMFRPQP